MAEILLNVESRDLKKDKNNMLRKSGIIPAIIYGRAKENKPIKLEKNDFLKKLHGSIASNIFIDLKIDNEEQPSKTVFIKKVQRSSPSRDIEHIDFIEINPNEKIHISVPIILVGQSPGVATGGLVEFILRSLEVECLPGNTPKDIKVDISNLQTGESIHAGNVVLGPEIKLVTNSGKTIVSIVERKEEVVAVSAEAAAVEGEAGAAPAEGEGAKPAEGESDKAAVTKEAKPSDAKGAKPADAKASKSAEVKSGAKAAETKHGRK